MLQERKGSWRRPRSTFLIRIYSGPIGHGWFETTRTSFASQKSSSFDPVTYFLLFRLETLNTPILPFPQPPPSTFPCFLEQSRKFWLWPLSCLSRLFLPILAPFTCFLLLGQDMTKGRPCNQSPYLSYNAFSNLVFAKSNLFDSLGCIRGGLIYVCQWKA